MKPRKLDIYIIEWAADDSEAKVLQQELARAGISITVRMVDDKNAFLRAVQSAIIHSKAHRASFPILHISSHGFEKGIGLSRTDFITWNEFGAAIGTDLSDRLILSMSACQGLRSWGMALMQSSPHYRLLVGTEEKPRWSDTKTGFPVFYRSLAHGKSIERAVDDLKASSGHSHFMVVPGPLVQQLRHEVVGAKTPNDIHDVRDKYGLPSLRHQKFSPVYPFRRITQ